SDLATLVSILISFSVFAQQAKVFEGKIGKYPVVLKITEDDTERIIWLNYFYLNQRKNIELKGDVNENGVIDASQMLYGFEGGEMAEKFLLKKNANGYKGTWVNGKSRLPVIL